MATWTHKGIEIGFDEKKAFFFATIDGARITASSLASMRDKLSKRAAVEGFDAIRLNYGQYEIVKIVDVAKGEFVDVSGRTYGSIARSTPENVRLVEAYLKLRKDNDTKIALLKNEVEEAYAAIPRERP